MTSTTLTTKGQLTLPKEIRDRMNLKSGDRLEVFPQDDGTILLRPATVDISELFGVLPKPEKPVTLEEMNEAIRQGVRR